VAADGADPTSDHHLEYPSSMQTEHYLLAYQIGAIQLLCGTNESIQVQWCHALSDSITQELYRTILARKWVNWLLAPPGSGRLHLITARPSLNDDCTTGDLGFSIQKSTCKRNAVILKRRPSNVLRHLGCPRKAWGSPKKFLGIYFFSSPSALSLSPCLVHLAIDPPTSIYSP